jgi:hypothetical protein
MPATPDPDFGKALTRAMDDFASDPQPPAFDAPAMVGRARRRRRLLLGGAVAAAVALGAGVTIGVRATGPGPRQVQAATPPTAVPASGLPWPFPSSDPSGSSSAAPGGSSSAAPSGTPSGPLAGSPSAARKTVTVPSVIGKPRPEAERILTAAGLTVGNLVMLHGGNLPTGVLVGTQPAAGMDVPVGTPVMLMVSEG